LGGPGVDGRTILRWIISKWDGGGAWASSGWLRERYRWWMPVNVVMNLWVP